MLADELRAMEDNLVGHFSYLQRLTPAMEVQETPALVVVNSGLLSDTFNVIYCRDPQTMSSADLGHAISHFRSRSLPFTVWCGPRVGHELAANLREFGLQQTEAETGVLLGFQEFVPSSRPAALSIVEVGDAAKLAEFAHILAANWSPPDYNVIQFFQLSQDAVLRSGASMRLFVGCWNGEAVATCEVFRTGRVAGIYNVATRNEYRQRGTATAMTSFGVHESIRSGCTLVSLQASAGAEGIYARLGFRACCTFLTFQEEDGNANR